MDWSNYYGYHRKKNVIRIIKQAEAQGCRPLDETLDNFKWSNGIKERTVSIACRYEMDYGPFVAQVELRLFLFPVRR